MEMRKKLLELYSSGTGAVEIDTKLFFQLYKLVCDMKRIADIANGERQVVTNI